MTLPERNRLDALRAALVRLHKSLLDSERIGYEQAFGTIPSAQDFLRLLLQDPWFAWLQPISLLIVKMDEALDAKDGGATMNFSEWITQTRNLLVASEIGKGFPKHYDDALQRDPNVVMEHAGVMILLRDPAPPA
jgi:hypothetical protein